MADLDKATATQLSNIEKRTGKSIGELTTVVRNSGLSKHGELVAMLKAELGMGHGDANLLVHVVRNAGKEGGQGTGAGSLTDILDNLYAGKKAPLRPIHERLQRELDKLGPFESAPKKTYISYRQKKQFAMIGPATNTQVEVGLNVRELTPTGRLHSVPAGQMCNYKVRLSSVNEVDAELLGWLRSAYDSSK
jgi:predicted transport protein